jgi:hypothetical protein
MRWPDGKQFAFTVFDDTDRATLDNVRLVYDFLTDCGLRTTKSVWPIAGVREPTIPGATCQDPGYRDWTLDLQRRGFEIGFHNATYHGSTRAQTERGLDQFRAIYGHDPRSAANHAENEEAMYWGAARLSGLHNLVYRVARLRNSGRFHGHELRSPLFWGDLCQQRIRYLRNFVYADINTTKACPWMPYGDPQRPFVKWWFASSEGATVRSFCETVSEENQDRLEAEGGLCIMYTHFAKGFQDGRGLSSRFRELMARISRKNGWFVPVSTALDQILATRGPHTLTDGERRVLERRWLRDQARAQASALARMLVRPRAQG